MRSQINPKWAIENFQKNLVDVKALSFRKGTNIFGDDNWTIETIWFVRFSHVVCKASAEPIGRLRLMTSTVRTTKRHLLLRCVPTSSTDHIIRMQQGQSNEIQILEIKPLVFLRPFEPFEGHNYYTNDAKFPAIPLHSTPIGTHIKALWWPNPQQKETVFLSF